MKRLRLIIITIIFPFLAYSQGDFLEDVLNAVNQDSLVVSLEELTGEKPFNLNGTSMTMPNRYFNNPGHSIVQEYLIDKFQNYGYLVETESFTYGAIVDICFSPEDSLRAWCISDNQTIFATTNGGEDWFRQTSINTPSKAIVSVNDTLVIALGSRDVYKRRDSANWEEIDLSLLEYGSFKDCFFLNENSGWLYGPGSLLGTNDGAETWTLLSNPEHETYEDVFFIDEEKGWSLKSIYELGADGWAPKKHLILSTTDGGNHWIKQDSTQNFPALVSIHFFDSLTGMVLAVDGKLFRTVNGGETWIEEDDLPGSVDFEEISFLDKEHGIIYSLSRVFITHDGGYTWTESTVNIDNKAYKISAGLMTDSASVYVVGEINLAFRLDEYLFARTEDEGITWSDLKHSIKDVLNQNIIATKTGRLVPDEYYVLSAHYDTKSTTPGADDNGSGVAAVYEAARILADYNFDYSIKYILFDAEEIGLIGSTVHTYNIDAAGLKSQIKGVINLDMLGYDGSPDGVFNIFSDNHSWSQAMAGKISSQVDSFNLDVSPVHVVDPNFMASDHASFWGIKVPAIFIMENFDEMNPGYHAPEDVIENMDLDYYTSIVRATVTTFAELASDTSNIVTGISSINNPIELTVSDPFPNSA